MKSYDGLFILLPNESEEVRAKSFADCEAVVNKFGGKVVQKEDWGKRSLGYPIRKNPDGSFINTELQLDPAKISELRKALELTDSLLKYMITVKVAEDKRKIDPKKEAVQKASAETSKPEKVADKK